MDINNEYGVLERQKDCLALLRKFDIFCQNKQIVYSLDSGSLLGAVRHKGFIPWDDDIDIIVDRATYPRLVKDLNDSGVFDCFTELWFTRIQFISNEKKSCSEAATIDVFVLDKTPKTKIGRKLKQFIVLLLQAIFKDKPSKYKFNFTWFRLWMGFQLGRLWSYEKKLSIFNKLSVSWINSNPKYVSCYNYTAKGLHALFDSDILQHTHRCFFEDIEVCIIDGYDKYLREIYGNYMILPPIEERIPKHV